MDTKQSYPAKSHILQAKSSKPLYGSPLFTARSQLKLDTERRLSNDASPQAVLKAPPHRQPSASRLAPLYAPHGGQPQQKGQQQQMGQMQPVAMTPMLPAPWGVLPSPAPQHLMTPVPPSAMQMPPMMASVLAAGPAQTAHPGAPPVQMLIPAVRSRSPDRQQQQQQHVVQQVSHVNSPAQLQPQKQHSKQPLNQPQSKPQPQPQQQRQGQPQQSATGFASMSPMPWVQGGGLQMAPHLAAMKAPNPQQLANGMPPLHSSAQPMGAGWQVQPLAMLPVGQPQPMHMQPVQPQPWAPQQQTSRQPSPAPRAKAQSSGKGVMYGRTVSMSGASQQPHSRAPSTAGSARGSSTGGGGGGGGREWNSYTTKKNFRRKTASIEPPRTAQTYTERLKSAAPRRSRSIHGGMCLAFVDHQQMWNLRAATTSCDSWCQT